MQTPSELNGGFRTYTNIPLKRSPFYGAKTITSKQATIKTGQVLKKYSLLQSDVDGKLIAHQGINEKALVTFANITNAQTIILGGLTYTASAGGSTKADIVKAFAGLAAGTTAAAANTQNTVVSGSFTSGTLTGWRTVLSSTADSVLFISTTLNTGVTDLADTGTATDPTIAITSVATKVVAGVVMYDVDASAADVVASVFSSASFRADALIWSVNPAVDTIELPSLATKVVTDYDTGCTTNDLKRKLFEGSSFELGFQSTGETY